MRKVNLGQPIENTPEGKIAWLTECVRLLASAILEGGTSARSSIGAAPNSAKYIVQTADPELTNEQVLGALATGLVKNTTTVGVLSIAAEGVDYYKPGGTDVAVADGGTGASTASSAATNLGLGTGNSPQFTGVNIGDPADTTVARLSAGDLSVEGNRIYRAGGTDVPVVDGGTGSSTASGAATNLGLGTGDSPQFTAVNIGDAADTTVARLSAGDVSVEGNRVFRVGGTDVPVADGGTGSSTAAGAATNLGLGTGNSPEFAAINIGDAADTTVTRSSAGNIAVEGNLIYRAGGTDVPVTDGGTGASTASGARTNLGLVEGTYTPTIANTTNVDASTPNADTKYLQVGSTVFVSGTVSIDCTIAGATAFTISLPIASNFAAFGNCTGTFVHGTSAVGRIIADTTNDVAKVDCTSITAANSVCSFIFMYIVI